MIIKITKASALNAIKGAKSDEVKNAIRELCSLDGKPETWEDICDQLGIDPNDPENALPFEVPKTDRQRAVNSAWILDHLSELAWSTNEKPLDWDDSSQYKWYAYADMRSGFGFSAADCAYRGTGTTVGSRLCFPTKAWAEYAFKTFNQDFQNWFIRKK